MRPKAAAKRMLGAVLAIMLTGLPALPAQAPDHPLDEVLARTSRQVESFVDQFSEVKCTEHVIQEKIGPKNKIERSAESSYDYLVILNNTHGDLTLDESRLAMQNAKQKRARNQSTPLLISNGFATLFLIFHPYYSGSFQFSSLGEDTIGGQSFVKVHFQHIRNKRSVAALAVWGREYPLDLSGTAWINPENGTIARITAGVDSGTEDIGMKTMRSEVDFAPVRFGGVESAYWFPSQAQVEVETQRQHWRNTHTFSDYKKFSVSTEEQVAKQ